MTRTNRLVSYFVYLSPWNKVGIINVTKCVALIKTHQTTIFQKNLQRILFHWKTSSRGQSYWHVPKINKIIEPVCQLLSSRIIRCLIRHRFDQCDCGGGLSPAQEGIQSDLHLVWMCNWLGGSRKAACTRFCRITVMRSVLISLSYGQYKLFIATLDMPCTHKDLQNKMIMLTVLLLESHLAEFWCPQLGKTRGRKQRTVGSPSTHWGWRGAVVWAGLVAAAWCPEPKVGPTRRQSVVRLGWPSPETAPQAGSVQGANSLYKVTPFLLQTEMINSANGIEGCLSDYVYVLWQVGL